MKIQKFYPLIFAVALSAASCDYDDPTVFTGGKGGSTVINIVPRHHGKPIEDCKIYIKYNAVDLPESYNDSAKVRLINGLPTAQFGGMRIGNYYVYGKGFDPEIGETVVGGSPITVNENGITATFNLGVSEGNGHHE